MEKYALFTNDVECHSIWFNKLRDETGMNVLKEGMPLLLDIYSEYNIKTTFFFTGKIAEKYPDIVKMILPYGHEVGCHGYSHEVKDAFDILTLEQQINHLKKAKTILEDIYGQEIISFRAPAGRVNKETPKALLESGFKIDSSVSSQRFDMFLSFGGIKKLNWLLSPRTPYHTKHNNLWKSGDGEILEIPISAFFLPYIGTTLRMIPLATKLLRKFLHFESSIINKPIVCLLHPNEMINEQIETNESFRRASNYISYIFRDIIRRKLKTRNLGTKSFNIFRHEIEFFVKKKYKFLTFKEYYRKDLFYKKKE